ncbi:MFS transporter [Nocardia inohanensis]|uniref:MFS transporter n=1 Tax=Nocardia inohanensis TaxID=209246 RepID=UPI00083215BF|nr:MFS transporter [Nocardia inohanensis]
MAAATPAPPIRKARLALFAVFGLNGMLAAIWIVHIPAVTERTGVTHTALGMLILLIAVGAITGMQTAGPLADRLGSRTLTAAAASALSLSIIGPGLASNAATLGIALAAYGFAAGALDVSMNSQAVEVERAYARPIMSAFHAFFSLGGLAGSIAGGAAQHAGWNIHLTLAISAGFGLALVAICAPRLLPRPRTAPAATEPDPQSGRSTVAGDAQAPLDMHVDFVPARAGTSRPDGEAEPAGSGGGRWVSRKVLALGVIAFALLMAEGVAADWSALQLRDRLGVDIGTAALGFGAFSTTMTAGRFAADRVSGRIGPVAVVRWGTLLAAIGFALVIASPWLPVTLLGWALCGLGLSGGVPQVFSAAGNLGSATAATDMSRVFTLGYLGFLAGPAIIGWLNKAVPLTAAMTVPLAAMLLCAWAAGVAAPASAEPRK